MTDCNVTREAVFEKLKAYVVQHDMREPTLVFFPWNRRLIFEQVSEWGDSMYAATKLGLGDTFRFVGMTAIMAPVPEVIFCHPDVGLLPRMLATIERLKIVASDKGQDACWYHPADLLGLMQVWDVTPLPPEQRGLPSRCEFEQGCKQYQEMLYGPADITCGRTPEPVEVRDGLVGRAGCGVWVT
jgi:hypothetical protein